MIPNFLIFFIFYFFASCVFFFTLYYMRASQKVSKNFKIFLIFFCKNETAFIKIFVTFFWLVHILARTRLCAGGHDESAFTEGITEVFS